MEQAEKEILLTGYTRSKTTMILSSEVAGKIISVNYDVGDTIGSKPVVEIDTTFVDFQIQNLRRSLQLLKNNLKKAEETVRYLEKEFYRIDRLYKDDRATEVKRDATEQELVQARLQMDSAAIETSRLEISLDEVLERKKRHQIFAPTGWTIVSKMVETGEQVLQSSPIVRVSDFRMLVVPLSVSDEELGAIRVLPSEFSAYLERESTKATIRWVNPDFDEKTRKLEIELFVIQYNGEKRGGLRFTLPLKIPFKGIQIPKTSVTSRYENPRVKLKATGEMINILVLGETDGHLIISEDPRLLPGTELSIHRESQ